VTAVGRPRRERVAAAFERQPPLCTARAVEDPDVVLPEPFAGDPERLARFEREAQTLAALTFDISSDGQQFIVPRAAGTDVRQGGLLVIQNWKDR
jgi:hypothetical protein